VFGSGSSVLAQSAFKFTVVPRFVRGFDLLALVDGEDAAGGFLTHGFSPDLGYGVRSGIVNRLLRCFSNLRKKPILRKFYVFFPQFCSCFLKVPDILKNGLGAPLVSLWFFSREAQDVALIHDVSSK
jgi:hypothetical protein